jgi:hypothetical protein
MPLTRISDSTQSDHPDLREFAVMATWVATREDAVGVREELVVDLVDEEQRSKLEPGEDDPLEVAWSVVYANCEAADQEVEARVTEGLAQDPEPWPIVRLGVRDPWPEQPGRWGEGVPGWVRSLGTNTALAHVQQDPYRRQRVVDWSAIVEPDDAT